MISDYEKGKMEGRMEGMNFGCEVERKRCTIIAESMKSKKRYYKESREYERQNVLGYKQALSEFISNITKLP